MLAEDVTVKNLTLTKITLAIVCIASLSACGKKKGNSAAAGPAAYATCTTGTNPYTGQPCVIGTPISGANTICPVNGFNPYTQQQCIPGQPVSPIGGYGQQINNPYYGQQPGYGGGGYGGQQNGCSQYQYQYGVPYYPQMINGQLMCVRGY